MVSLPVLDKQDNALPSEKDKKLADEGAKVLAAQQSIRMSPESVDHLLNLTNQAQQLAP